MAPSNGIDDQNAKTEEWDKNPEDFRSTSKCEECGAITMALLVRLIFGLLGVVGIWRVVSIYGPEYWTLMIVFILWLAEMIIAFVKRRGREWPYFSPCVFATMCCSIPSIWMIEISRTAHARAGLPPSTNTTLWGLENLEIPLGEFEWAIAMEQALMCLLIVGKWLLPRGDVSKDQLSQVLLVYLALAADMVDLFELIAEPGIYENEVMVYALLGIWSLSMIQFSLALATTRGSSLNFDDDESDIVQAVKNEQEPEGCKKYLQDLEVWAIFVTMGMQDGPYFVFRMCAIIIYKVDNYTNYFFTAKNALFLVLQTYRLCIIVCSCCKEMDSYTPKVPSGLGVSSAMHFDKKDGVSKQHTKTSLIGFNRVTSPGPGSTRKSKTSLEVRQRKAIQKMIAVSRKK